MGAYTCKERGWEGSGGRGVKSIGGEEGDGKGMEEEGKGGRGRGRPPFMGPRYTPA